MACGTTGSGTPTGTNSASAIPRSLAVPPLPSSGWMSLCVSRSGWPPCSRIWRSASG
jgi:hypothetical protein